MTLPQIFWQFKLDDQVYRQLLDTSGSKADKEIVNIIRNLIPMLQHVARAETAVYLDVPEAAEKIPQEMIINYLLRQREYDAVDISRIVNYWRQRNGTNERTGNK
jgi:hypothetical protein